ncbi:MAG: lipoyl(octanoyl) transferase LipB [Gemmatimonadota bacterium]
MTRSRREIRLVPVAGRVPYADGLAWQRRLARDRIEGRLARDIVLLLEHEPVLTVGRGGGASHVLAAPRALAAAGIDLVEVERGGDVTYHGPGQLVGYPLIDLGGYRKDLHWYVRRLEEALIRALGELGLAAFRVPDYTGVWVGEEGRTAPADRAAGRIRKIASIGVHVSRWVTWHGFALNLTEEPLRRFDLIVPCGIPDVHMTCLRREGVRPDPARVTDALRTGFGDAFGAAVEVGAPIQPGAGPAAVASGGPPGGIAAAPAGAAAT